TTQGVRLDDHNPEVRDPWHHPGNHGVRPDKFESAARFAFLIAAPIMAGTGALEGYKLAKHGLPAHFVQIFLPGFLMAAAVGLLAIGFMLRYLRKGTLTPFIIYRFAVAGIVLIVLAVRA
ncbi:MAG TPA: undecaprenyl-diphosphate phosphatase, partial [Candidatus Anoxymicrobiaceae bacterium]